ncbi:hypothetical protein EB796_021774 [Bugula neritina]|uniref:Uncharacterized protein n=1 Tax=Bugula neritina TaxID=10212 RepID=A0A7J7J1G2_BUGNE|nr:hypothetical protein EB796_021774 [Bugula neritina]
MAKILAGRWTAVMGSCLLGLMMLQGFEEGSFLFLLTSARLCSHCIQLSFTLFNSLNNADDYVVFLPGLQCNSI